MEIPVPTDPSSDKSWFNPNETTAYVAPANPPGPGWWKASDGEWYPPQPTVATAPPSWHADPQRPDMLRWWDGQAWTEHRHQISQPVTVAPEPARRTPTFAEPTPKRRGRKVVWAGLALATGIAGYAVGSEEPATQNAAVVTPTVLGVVESPTTAAPSTTAPPPPTSATTTSTTSTTTSTTTTTEPVDIFAALTTAEAREATAWLDEIEIVAEVNPEIPYDRDAYQPGGWLDLDGNCQTGRHEVLIRDANAEVDLSADGCFVDQGQWTDAWSKESPLAIDQAQVDHLVPLSHAHKHGGWQWDDATKQAFAHDLLTLAVVGQATNSSKGASSPAEWRPPAEQTWCGYAIDWIRTKVTWELTALAGEVGALRDMLDTCDSDGTDGPRGVSLQQGIAAVSIATTTTTTTTTTAAPAPTTTAAPERNCDPNYTGCVPIASDVDCAGGSGNGPAYVRGPVEVIGRDIYRLDGDGDGIACE